MDIREIKPLIDSWDKRKHRKMDIRKIGHGSAIAYVSTSEMTLTF